jgi:phosphatidylglycerophosphatase A
VVHGAEALAGLGLVAAAALFLAGSATTLAFGARARAADGSGDPGWVVSDEVAGQALASAAAVRSGGWTAALLALVLFRLLDVGKPPPVRQAEAAPGGLGVLLDDLVAGVLAGGITVGLVLLLEGTALLP